MAELDAFSKAVNGFTTNTVLSADGSAVINLSGAPAPNEKLHPALHLTRADVAAVLKGLSKPVPAPSKLLVGLNNLSGWGMAAQQTMSEQTGITLNRYEVNFSDIETEVATLKEAVANGAKQMLLYMRPAAERTGETITRDMATLATLIKELDLPPIIEERNEPYYEGLQPAEVAAQYADAHAALAGSDIALIAKAWGDYDTSSEEWSQQEAGRGWCVDFCKALAYTPDAWGVHAYGPMAAAGPFGGGNPCGWASVLPLIEFLKEHGINAPMLVTEVGQRSSAGTDGPAQVSEAEQAADYATYVRDAAEWGLAGLFIYEAVDTGEGGYGAFSWPLTPKLAAGSIKQAVESL